MEVGLQSVGAYIVGDTNHATFFSFASMLGLAGEIAGGPIMAKMYAFRDQDQRPLGYCFFLSMVGIEIKKFSNLQLTFKQVLFSCLLFCSYYAQTGRLQS